MKKEVSQEYIKYMNQDGQCDKAHFELMRKKEIKIVDYWINKTKDDMCYNCSYVFIDGFCPCRLKHIEKEIQELLS